MSDFIAASCVGVAQVCVGHPFDTTLTLIQNKINQGISFNRNLAIEEAKGKYIAMIDGDDLALPERLEKQLVFLEKNL